MCPGAEVSIFFNDYVVKQKRNIFTLEYVKNK